MIMWIAFTVETCSTVVYLTQILNSKMGPQKLAYVLSRKAIVCNQLIFDQDKKKKKMPASEKLPLFINGNGAS